MSNSQIARRAAKVTELDHTSQVEHIYFEWDKTSPNSDVEALTQLYAEDAITESPLVPHLMGKREGGDRHDRIGAGSAAMEPYAHQASIHSMRRSLRCGSRREPELWR